MIAIHEGHYGCGMVSAEGVRIMSPPALCVFIVNGLSALFCWVVLVILPAYIRLTTGAMNDWTVGTWVAVIGTASFFTVLAAICYFL